jgi:hypothetical protein
LLIQQKLVLKMKHILWNMFISNILKNFNKALPPKKLLLLFSILRRCRNLFDAVVSFDRRGRCDVQSTAGTTRSADTTVPAANKRASAFATFPFCLIVVDLICKIRFRLETWKLRFEITLSLGIWLQFSLPTVISNNILT